LKHDYNDYLRLIWDTKESYEYNFGFSKSGTIDIPSKHPLKSQIIPADIGTVKMFYEPGFADLFGLQLLNRENKIVYQSARKDVFKNQKYKSITTKLAPGERILGTRSHTNKG
jgi:hypothetical protein